MPVAASTPRFGTDVQRADVLDVAASNPQATIIADLAAADAVPADMLLHFDEYLQYIGYISRS